MAFTSQNSPFLWCQAAEKAIELNHLFTSVLLHRSWPLLTGQKNGPRGADSLLKSALALNSQSLLLVRATAVSGICPHHASPSSAPSAIILPSSGNRNRSQCSFGPGLHLSVPLDLVTGLLHSSQPLPSHSCSLLQPWQEGLAVHPGCPGSWLLGSWVPSPIPMFST